MTIESKNKVYLAGLVLAVLVGLTGLAKAAGITALINVQNGTFNLSGLQGGVNVENPVLGSAQTVAVSLTDTSVLTNLDSLFLWGTGTGQGFEVAGYSYLADVRTTALVEVGLTTFTATSTATAAQVCNTATWNLAMASALGTITLPASSSLFADCLTANGDRKEVTLYNTSGFNAVIAAGSGSVLDLSTTTAATIPTGSSANLVLFRTSTSGGYRANLSLNLD